MRPRWLAISLFLAVVMLVLAACSDMQIVIPGVEKVLYRDDFVLGQTGTWKLESDENGSTTIVPEQLLIKINNPNMVQYASLVEPEVSDFRVEVDGHILSGSPQSSYGVLFRMQGPQQFYRYEITGDGTYILERHDSGGPRTLFMGDWRSSDAINQGLNMKNRLGVNAVGPNISLYVNDVLLEEISDDTYLEGKIALDAGTFAMAPAQIAFDNMVIYPSSR